MKKFIRYLYEYQNGRRVQNAGFIKAEESGSSATLQIYGKGFPAAGRSMEILLFYLMGDQVVGISMGLVQSSRPMFGYRLEYTAEDVGGEEIFQAIEGVIILSCISGMEMGNGRISERAPVGAGQGCRWYAATWNDSAVAIEKMIRREEVLRQAPKAMPGENGEEAGRNGESEQPGGVGTEPGMPRREQTRGAREESGMPRREQLGGEREESGMPRKEQPGGEREEPGMFRREQPDGEREEPGMFRREQSDSERKANEIERGAWPGADTEKVKDGVHRDMQPGGAREENGINRSTQPNAEGEEPRMPQKEQPDGERKGNEMPWSVRPNAGGEERGMPGAERSDSEREEREMPRNVQANTEGEEENTNRSARPGIGGEEHRTQWHVRTENEGKQAWPQGERERSSIEGTAGRNPAQEQAAGNRMQETRQELGEKEVQDEPIYKISRRDLAKLPRREWKLANNHFLMHGYRNYHHLISFKKDGYFWLGVPGVYHPREQQAASAFGFGQFMRPKGQETSLNVEERDASDEFGYWCRVVSALIQS